MIGTLGRGSITRLRLVTTETSVAEVVVVTLLWLLVEPSGWLRRNVGILSWLRLVRERVGSHRVVDSSEDGKSLFYSFVLEDETRENGSPDNEIDADRNDGDDEDWEGAVMNRGVEGYDEENNGCDLNKDDETNHDDVDAEGVLETALDLEVML